MYSDQNLTFFILNGFFEQFNLDFSKFSVKFTIKLKLFANIFSKDVFTFFLSRKNLSAPFFFSKNSSPLPPPVDDPGPGTHQF